MGIFQAGLVRHPRWMDAGLAALLVAVTAPGALSGAGPGQSAWFLVAHTPLVWRRRWPVAVFWVVFGLAIIAVVIVGIRVESLYPELLVTVTVYTAARYGRRRDLVPIVVAIVVPAVAVFVLVEDPDWTAFGFVTSTLAAAVLLGIAVSIRRAFLDAQEDRARRLELERDQQAQIAVAAERARIARDMHDVVAHNLAVMIALTDGAALTAAAAPERAVATMHQVAATGREALGEMRRVLGLLREEGSGLTPQPGPEDLDALVDRVRAAGVRVNFSVDGAGDATGVGVGVGVYRIVQEALTNTLKHAGPHASAYVELHYRDDGLEVEITDDGAHLVAVPTPRLAATGGQGLTGMAERAAAYGGEMEAGPRDGAPGWRVRAWLPLDQGGRPSLEAP